jgi:hypothetical protein
MSDKQSLEAYSADISVTFEEQPPFKGKVYIQGDGNHAVFHWPDQTNTIETTELAEFETQTKWVKTAKGCVRSKFTEPDPKFAGMVSHKGYKLVSSECGKNIYLSDGISCTYDVDEQQREAILSIVFQNTRIEFTEVVFAPQDPSRFVPPPDCKAIT